MKTQRLGFLYWRIFFDQLLQDVFNNNFYKKSDVCSCMDLIAVLITQTESYQDTCDFLPALIF